ncbi:MAG: hypothetical protein KJO52_06420, partial [Maribacter sp.]|nr:hypothetical protein [Maribacter sp.]
MKKFLKLCMLVLVIVSCSKERNKIPVYAWTGGPGDATDQKLRVIFQDFKEKGIDGLMYNGGQNPKTYERVGALVKEAGMEF